MMDICWIPIILLYILCVYWFLLFEIFPYCDGIYDLTRETLVGAVHGDKYTWILLLESLFGRVPHLGSSVFSGSGSDILTHIALSRLLIPFVWNFATLPVFQFGINIHAMLFMLTTLPANCLIQHLVL